MPVEPVDGQGEGQQGEFSGESLLTRPDESGTDGAGEKEKGASEHQEQDEQGDDEKADAKDAADTVPDKPDGYAITFEKDTAVDTQLLGEFQKTAHELGISQEKAQKLASFYEAQAKKAGTAFEAAQQASLEKARTGWEAEIQSRPNFAQEREHARSALRQYGDAELYALIDQTNLGSHPKMWDFLAKIGKELAEPGFRGKDARNPQSAADILYPDQGKH
jgi:hypothetical protein